MKQQRNVITEYCFVRPIYLFLNQMNSCDTWLARFDWHQPHTSYFKSAYHILDLVFWFGHLSILTKNHYSVTQHDMNLSRNMISDLAYFARKVRCHGNVMNLNIKRYISIDKDWKRH